jgi:hypothetical protein
MQIRMKRAIEAEPAEPREIPVSVDGVDLTQAERERVDAWSRALLDRIRRRQEMERAAGLPVDEFEIGTIRIVPGPRTPEQEAAMGEFWRGLISEARRRDTGPDPR